MSKTSALDRAIQNIEQEIQVLELAVTKLRQQRDTKKTFSFSGNDDLTSPRKPKTVTGAKRGGGA